MPPTASHLLSIETSSAQGSVALATADGGIRSREFTPGLVHGREVLSHVDALLREAGLPPADLELLAVSMGPGSYTGMRVGVTVAKSLAFAVGCAVVPVGSLAVIAANACLGREAGEPEAVPIAMPIAVALDGRQGQLYLGLFSAEAEPPRLERLAPETVLDLAAIEREGLPQLPRDARVVGDGAALLFSCLGPERAAGLRRGPSAWDLPRAAILLQLAAAFLESRGANGGGGELRPIDGEVARGLRRLEGDAVHGLEPHYLRPSDAERRWPLSAGR